MTADLRLSRGRRTPRLRALLESRRRLDLSIRTRRPLKKTMNATVSTSSRALNFIADGRG